MWIVYFADDSHEMSEFVFSEKKEKECRLLQILLGVLRVKLSAEFAKNQLTDKIVWLVVINPTNVVGDYLPLILL